VQFLPKQSISPCAGPCVPPSIGARPQDHSNTVLPYAEWREWNRNRKAGLIPNESRAVLSDQARERERAAGKRKRARAKARKAAALAAEAARNESKRPAPVVGALAARNNAL
jgi:hypothetical protein